MGRLLEGQWITHDLGTDAQGRYVRRATQFRATPEEVEPGRYLLVVSWACGWSHRALLVRALLGLDDDEILPALYTDAFMGENGWTFTPGIYRSRLFQQKDDDDKDADEAAVTALHQVYVLAQSDYTGRASVPVLWDTKKGVIVNNESSDIVQILLRQFAPLRGNKFRNRLMPPVLETAIHEMIQANYGPINNGVYKCGFASSQEAYYGAAKSLFERLDQLEQLLGRQRYLLPGDQPTLADICLFPTLVRFDHVYYTHFKCNRKHVYEYPNLWGWTRDVYQLPGVKETVNFDDIRQHYYTSHESIHPRRYIPLGPNLDFDAPHGRDKDY